MRIYSSLLAAAASLVVGACGNDEYHAVRYYCAGFVPSSQITSTIGTGCVGCTANNLPAAIDESIDTYADLNLATAAAGQGITIQATETNGTPFAAGTSAGALVNISAAGSSEVTVTLTTYLAGTEQETSTPVTIANVMNSPADEPNGYYGFVTAKTFDSVSFAIVNGSSATISLDVHLHGMCASGGGLY